MHDSAQPSADILDDGAFVRALVEESLSRGELMFPHLPEVAINVVRAGARAGIDARQLADVINTDRALAGYVLRVAGSAANRPKTPLGSLAHAVAWLGFDEVANIAFTLALQARMLDVPGRQPHARRLWRHALSSALWSRQLALMMGEAAAVCYLCGLLDDIGKVVTLGIVHDVARRSGRHLSGSDYDRLIEEFERRVAACVLDAWGLPETILRIIARCGVAREADSLQCPPFAAHIVLVAHRLADSVQWRRGYPARDQLCRQAAYRQLGLDAAAESRLFDSAAEVHAELDRYLAP